MATQAFTLKNFNGGLSDYEDKGVRGAFKNGKALSVRRRIDSLYCNQALVSVDDEGTPVITDLVRFFVPASDGNTYLFGAAKIYKLTSGGTLSLVHTDPDGQISGASEWWEANGKEYLFWTTSTKLKSKEIPGSSDWSDVNADHTGLPGDPSTQSYPKTNLTAQEWHTMRQANGALMICNGNYIAMVGWDGSYTNEALRLIPGVVSKTIIDRNDFVIIAAGSDSGRQYAHLFEWETGSLNYITKKRIPAVTINALIDSEIMLMQADNDGEIFFSDFVNFLPVTSFPAGGKVNPGAIIDDNGIVYFGVYDSNDATKDGIYSYGRTKKNGTYALNFEYPITCDEIGALEVIGGLLHVTYKVGSSYKLYKVDTTKKQPAVYESLDLLAPIKFPVDHTGWSGIKVHCSKLPENSKIGLKYRMDKDSSWVTALLESGDEFFDIQDGQEALFLVGSVGEIFELQVTLYPNQTDDDPLTYGNNSPEVHKIEIFFE